VAFISLRGLPSLTECDTTNALDTTEPRITSQSDTRMHLTKNLRLSGKVSACVPCQLAIILCVSVHHDRLSSVCPPQKYISASTKMAQVLVNVPIDPEQGKQRTHGVHPGQRSCTTRLHFGSSINTAPPACLPTARANVGDKVLMAVPGHRWTYPKVPA
jgi:hypothetical protein